MNVFWLHRRPEAIARYHDDARVVKMCTEAAQLLCTAFHIRADDPASSFRLDPYLRDRYYDPFNYHNSLPYWCAESRTHARTVYEVVGALSDEYQRRFDSAEPHGSWATVRDAYGLINEIPDHGWREPPFYGPDEYDTGDLVSDYRRYYAYEKGASAVYARAEVPSWWPDDAPEPQTRA